MLSNMYDMKLWLWYFFFESFEILGFIISYLIDIIEEEFLFRLCYKLLECNFLVEEDKLEGICNVFRDYFVLFKFKVGLMVIDYLIENIVVY